MRVAGHGISIDVPPGWEARVFRRGGGGAVLHVATFELLDGDGDFGAAATGRMRGDGVFAALIEYRVDDRLRGGVGLFAAAGLPASPEVHEFSPMQLQVTRRGQLGRQRFFTHDSRPYCLYLVIQPVDRPMERMTGELSNVLATLKLPGGGP
jgi:hypothetical protein